MTSSQFENWSSARDSVQHESLIILPPNHPTPPTTREVLKAYVWVALTLALFLISLVCATRWHHFGL